MEERAERETEASLGCRELPDGVVGEVRAARPSPQALEQPHVVAGGRGPGGERPGHGQRRVDGRDVGDRRLLELERGLVLAAVRDLEHRSGGAVVDQEGLVALAAEWTGL